MFLLYSRHGRPTGSVLAQSLGIAHGNSSEDREEYLIRWGATGSTAYRAGFVLNRRDAIRSVSDKLNSLEVMQDRGVPIPRWATNPSVLTAPFLGRNREHTRGTDIVLCMQQADVQHDRDFYVEYIPTKRELRMHVFDGRVIRRQEKVPQNGANRPGVYCRNHNNGFVFRTPRNTVGNLQDAVAIQAVQAHGLLFGAVDLIVGDDTQTYVLEVNAAPACSPATGKAYVDAFMAYFGEKGCVITPDYDTLEQLRTETEVEDA